MDRPMRLPVLRDGELERWLEAYATVRLTPDPASANRLRARVMREWDDRSGPLGRSLLSPKAAPSRRSSTPVRRLMLPAAAAALGMSVLVGSTLAATPGAPLYGARVWVETLALPADASARARAQVARLDQRMAEALDAAKNGNAAGAAAAMVAYREILAIAVVEASAGDHSRLTLLAPAIARHESVLAKLLVLVPADAQAAVTAAIEGVQRVTDQLDVVGSLPPGAPRAATPTSPNPPALPERAAAAPPVDDGDATTGPAPVTTRRPSLAPPPAEPGLLRTPAPTVQPDTPREAAPVATPRRTASPSVSPAPSPKPSAEPVASARPTPRPTARPAPIASPPAPERSPQPLPSSRVEMPGDVPTPEPSTPEPERRETPPPAPVQSVTPDPAREPQPSPPPAPTADPSVPAGDPDPTPRPSPAVATPAPSIPSPAIPTPSPSPTAS